MKRRQPRNPAAFFNPNDSRRVPRRVVSALGRMPSVVSSSQVATRCAWGSPGKKCIATYLWKRLALSLRQEDRSSPEVSFSFESLLSWLCVASRFSSAAKSCSTRRDESSHVPNSRGRGVFKTCGEKPKPNQWPEKLSKTSPFFPCRHARECGHPRVFVRHFFPYVMLGLGPSIHEFLFIKQKLVDGRPLPTMTKKEKNADGRPAVRRTALESKSRAFARRARP